MSIWAHNYAMDIDKKYTKLFALGQNIENMLVPLFQVLILMGS
jgi:hypothetical protein